MGSRMLRRDFRQSYTQVFAMYRTWRQAANYRYPLVILQSRFNTRHMSVFSEISKRVKGEVESNPELKKSIKELKEKAGEIKAITEDLKERHREILRRKALILEAMATCRMQNEADKRAFVQAC